MASLKSVFVSPWLGTCQMLSTVHLTIILKGWINAWWGKGRGLFWRTPGRSVMKVFNCDCTLILLRLSWSPCHPSIPLYIPTYWIFPDLLATPPYPSISLLTESFLISLPPLHISTYWIFPDLLHTPPYLYLLNLSWSPCHPSIPLHISTYWIFPDLFATPPYPSISLLTESFLISLPPLHISTYWIFPDHPDILSFPSSTLFNTLFIECSE